MEISDKRQAGEDIGYLKGGVIIAQRLFSALMVPPVLVLFLFQRLPDRDQQLHLVLLQARLHCRSLQVLASPGFTILLTISNSFKKTLASRKSVSRVLSKVLSRALSGVTPWCHSLVSLSGVTQMSTSYWCICPTKVCLSRGINLQASHLTTTTLNSWSALIFEVNFTLVPKSAPIPPPWGSLSSLSSPSSSSSSSSSSSELEAAKPARLYPNVRGCGYPPTLHCDGQ